MGDEILYSHQVETLASLGKTRGDSLRIVNQYIEDWIKRQLILEKAEMYLPNDKTELERKVRDYKESLLVHLYESELIRQKLDTNITNEQVTRYFENFKDKFKLSQTIVSLIYIKLKEGAPKQDSARYWLKHFNYDETYPKLHDYCLQYAEDYMLNDTAWIEVEKMASQMPIDIEKFSQKARLNQFVEASDSFAVYMVRVNDFRIKGRYAPLNYIRDEIRKTILNKRKLDLVNSTYKNIYKEAEALGKFEVLK